MSIRGRGAARLLIGPDALDGLHLVQELDQFLVFSLAERAAVEGERSLSVHFFLHAALSFLEALIILLVTQPAM